MKLIICPGIHPAYLTNSFVNKLQLTNELLVLPTDRYPPYSAIHINLWLKQNQISPQNTALFFIAFSAGVVGSIGAALAWQLQGGKVAALVAIDGWGVPLFANFPIYRFSHDYFTHWSSALLGMGEESFYADPSVEHLEIWRSPELCWGWQVASCGLKSRCIATEYLHELMIRHS